MSEITLESADLTDVQTAAIQNLINENKVTNVTLKDGKIQIQPLLQKTDDGKYDKVAFPMVNMPKVNFTIKYKLKESQFHDEESEVFTGIASSYDVLFTFGQDSKIPANTNKDVCELNPVEDITRHRVVKRVEDINIKTTSMEYEKQTQVDDVAKNIFQKELSALDTANEEFKYTVEYHMGTGISHKEDVRIVDDINENVQILEVKLKGYDPVEKIEKETVIQPNDNKIEYVFEKYQDSNDAIKSYDYLEGRSYTLTIRAKIKMMYQAIKIC